MQEIQTLLEQDSSVLFLAPTGWGKTTLLLELAKNTHKSIVYLSPLRALANEFHLRCLQEGLRAFAPSSRRELAECLQNGLEFKLWVLTAELLYEKAIEELLEGKILVFDEFHLFYYWGKDFRPALMEVFELSCVTSQTTLLLTATASVEVIEFWKERTQMQEQFLINLGNQRIKKEPKNFFWTPKKEWAIKYLEIARPGTKLVFCRYRAEAKELAKEFKAKGHRTLSCVSGEIEEFQDGLAKMERPDYIFCTSTLSHGVNLPEISTLIILYRVNNLDLWLQMAGRAGRKGEDFDLISADRGNRSLKTCAISLFWFLCHYSLVYFQRLKSATRRHYHSKNAL